jgi:HAD superfamily hydrolase (TIGR01509 family)
LSDVRFGAIWDLDGTLVDTEANHYSAWRAFMQEHGRDLTHDQFRPTFGLRNDDILLHYLGFSGNVAEIAALGERKEEMFRASLERDGITLQPGAGELIEHLQAIDARQAIASSAPPANIALMMRLLGFANVFDAIVSSEEVLHGKPAPDLFLRAVERLGLPPSRTVVLEDALAGVQAGKAAGARVIAIASTLPPERLGEADLVVRSFAEVLWPEQQWEEFLGHA